MCGIAGLWNTQLPEPATTVGAMLEAMRHRGPDGCGTLEFSGGAAGMVRLALVDLSERGQQPMWSDDRRVAIVFNGEIYNFREERRRLEDAGHRFHSTTDSEVILQLYLERGLDFHERLRGMYALAIFDWRKAAPGGLPQLVLARDPLGIKPLYLAHAKADRQSVVFASEMRGILASGLVRPEICRQSLAGYLGRGFLLQPATMISGVRMLDPGTLECYSPGEAMRSIRFWTMPSAAPRTETLDEAAARLRATLDESVALHAMADAPIGAFLSGGIDSTAIVALMRRRIADLRTYTLRFPDVQGDDEVSEAEAAARKYGCHHTTVDVTAAEVRELLPRFAGELDQPSADGLNTWMISRAAAHDVKGVLSGLGGDEWFSGYPVTRRMAHLSTTFSGRVQTVAGQVASQFAGFVPGGRLRQRVENLAARRSAIALWSQGHTVFRPDVARRMAGIDRRDDEMAMAAVLEQDGDWAHETMVGLACRLDTRVYMANQLLRDSDATSMAHSLELRVPFVDLEIVKFSRTCADEHKLRSDGGDAGHYEGSGAKRVLIHALRDVLPPDIAMRQKKGFALPFERWMRGELADLVRDTCSREAIARRGLLNPDAVHAARAIDGRGGMAYPGTWTLMILELWCRAALDGRQGVRPANWAAATA